ncbi:hypothetical protein [Actinacidiphila guanduensis]|uniref:hypothetical protein n=1 Tax=Actinacidiphila guanduensis TaxID=310781 RepID=UPI000B813F5B|nr:hypothetical protein [Actinacidiphila guanduensis]
MDVDLAAFRSVYKEYEATETELRNRLTDIFAMRLDKVGPDWFRVAEKDGSIEGFLVSCPTRKTPDEFKSWEETTDGGTLMSTYDPSGPNVYVVSLSMLPKAGEGARNMLILHTMGKVVEGGYDQFFFESRLPGLLSWSRRRCRDKGRTVESLTEAERYDFAESYFHSTRDVKGKQVPLDPLLRIYDQIGCTFLRVFPDAYEDAKSMNFGVVGVWRNPVPRALRKNFLVRKVVGGAFCTLSRSHRLTGKAFS